MREKKFKIYLTEKEIITLEALTIGQKESSHLLVGFGKMNERQIEEEDFYDKLINKLILAKMKK